MREMKAGNGVLLVDKPIGVFSREIVNRLGEILGTRRVGHAGTLDPNATGLFIVLVGSATKLSRFFMEGRKSYRATIRFGITTDTYDSEGKVIKEVDPSGLDIDKIRTALHEFRGMIQQSPPPFAAVKLRGKRLYCYARKGEIIRLPPRPITIYSLNILSWFNPYLKIEVTCSKGTYLRSLAHDLGQFLGVGAHLYEIRRFESEPFHVQQAAPFQELLKLNREELRKKIIPVDQALYHLPCITLTAAEDDKIKNGKPLPPELILSRLPKDLERGALFRLLSPNWLAIMRLNRSAREILQGMDKRSPFSYERVIPR